jgi:hypothetical protein
MKIAVLGWGSLIWDRGVLKIKDCWKADGPFLPIEFARISEKNGGRLTLVIHPNTWGVQTLWAISAYDDLNRAIENLACREKTPKCNIGFACILDNSSRCKSVPNILPIIQCWAKEKKLDAVIWTDLCSNFKKKLGKELNEDNVIEYLRSLNGETKCRAEEYICKVPEQIKTKFRRRIIQELGWLPINSKICCQS